MTASATSITVEDDTADGPLSAVDWGCAWETDAAHELLGAVRAICGVPPARPELTDEMVAAALAEARAILVEAGELEDADPGGAHVPVPGDDAHDGDADDRIDGGDGDHHRDEDAWSAPSWHEAAEQYHTQRGERVAVVEIDPQNVARLRRLFDDGVALQRAWHELNRTPGRAAASTVEALMLGLRERGVRALDEPGTQRRLGELNDEQAIEVGTRLRRLNPTIATPWTSDQVEILIQLRERLK
jgi:hypothetical protein